MPANATQITGILLAAGMGQRFKQAHIPANVPHHKLLHPLSDGRSILQHSAEKFSKVCPHGLIVFSAQAESILQQALRAQVAHLPLHILFCPDAETGMAASLVHALQYSKTDSAAWLIALADMPFIHDSSYQKILSAMGSGADIVAPTFQKRRGHPIGISRRYLPDLLALRGDVGARAILQRETVLEIDVNDAGILRDVDTLADV